MTYQEKKEPLYRKVNTRTRMVHHNSGGDFRHSRNTKKQKEKENEDSGVTRQGISANVKRGLDYTPLFRFLLSKVGKSWTEIHKEAISRLDKEEPIFWMVAKNDEEKSDYFCAQDNSYYHGLYVDEQGLLQKVNPNFQDTQKLVFCTCCTHTFNGSPIVIKKQNKVSTD